MHDREHEPDRQAVRAAVEAGDQTRLAICKAFRISRGELARRIEANKWDAAERDDGQDRGLLLDGLRWVLERQIDRVGEAELTDAVKEAAVLQRLASTLEDLVRLGDKGAGGQRTPRQTKEMGELRQKIARRLDELDLH